jgi:excisionase family DNA binding protein
MNETTTTTQDTAPRLLYDRKEAARQLSISVRSIDYMVTSRKITTRRIGSRVLIPHAELVRLATSADLRSVA